MLFKARLDFLLGPEQVTCADDLSIFVRKWNPSTFVLDDFQEVVLRKDATIANLKKMVITCLVIVFHLFFVCAGVCVCVFGLWVGVVVWEWVQVCMQA